MANYSICIGVSKYRNIGSLNYAHKDAQDLHNLFTHKFKFKKTKLFRTESRSSDDSEYQSSYELATYTNIYNYLCDSFDETVKSPFTLADNFWFFFSGHGRNYQDKHYLLPCDVSSLNTALKRTALAVEDIAYRLREYSGAGNIIMLIDASRKSGRKSLSTPFNKQRGIITIASCEPKGFSYEIKELKNGSFTYALCQSLEALTDDNCATVEKLINSLRWHVAQINLKYKAGEQIPYAILEPSSKNNLLLLPEYINPSLADIDKLEKEAFKAEANGDLKEAETIWRSLIKPYSDEAIDALIRIALIRQQKENKFFLNDLFYVEVKEKATVSESDENITEAEEIPNNFTEDLGNGSKLEMIYIEGGTFMMGTDDTEIESLCKKYNRDWFKSEAPQHQVTLPPFYMSKYAITQAQYQAIMGKNPSHFQEQNNPVEKVSWDDAQEFCQQLSAKVSKQYKLPSEAQWEYACRAGSTNKWYFGDDESPLKDYAWYSKNANDKTHSVGQKKPNQWSLYDMHGNVWEWCEDNWHDNYDNAPSDGSSWTNKASNIFVVRGGSWFNSLTNCRCACRYVTWHDVSIRNIGFRVVCGIGRV